MEQSLIEDLEVGQLVQAYCKSDPGAYFLGELIEVGLGYVVLEAEAVDGYGLNKKIKTTQTKLGLDEIYAIAKVSFRDLIL